MIQIVIHCKPKENSEQFGKVIGAYAAIFIDFKDIDGAFELAKFYVNENDWEVIEVDEKYFVTETKEEMDEDYQQYFEEIMEYGYSMIFNTYNELDDSEE
jgi:hypothetical protein